jgi:hypothetical protein
LDSSIDQNELLTEAEQHQQIEEKIMAPLA